MSNSKITSISLRKNAGRFDLMVETDGESPGYPNMKFEKRGNLYRAQSGIWISFFAYKAPGDGYGGAAFDIELVDGTKETLIGPWSSNADSIFKAFPDRDEPVNVILPRCISGHISRNAIEKWIEENPKCGIELYDAEEDRSWSSMRWIQGRPSNGIQSNLKVQIGEIHVKTI